MEEKRNLGKKLLLSIEFLFRDERVLKKYEVYGFIVEILNKGDI